MRGNYSVLLRRPRHRNISPIRLQRLMARLIRRRKRRSIVRIRTTGTAHRQNSNNPIPRRPTPTRNGLNSLNRRPSPSPLLGWSHQSRLHNTRNDGRHSQRRRRPIPQRALQRLLLLLSLPSLLSSGQVLRRAISRTRKRRRPPTTASPLNR